MYSIILFEEETNKLLDSITVDDRPVVEGNDIFYKSGSFIGINVPFIVIEGEHTLNANDPVTDLLPKDLSSQLISENAQLKNDLAQTQQVLNDIMLGGM